MLEARSLPDSPAEAARGQPRISSRRAPGKPCQVHLSKHSIMADQKQEQQPLSDEDKKILEDAHKNRDNPEHPAHQDHPKHHDFLKSIPQRLGGAAIFGAGATAGGDLVNGLINH